ncbi:MAG: hypothetical protein QM758_13855 [Armatimonas sp.]
MTESRFSNWLDQQLSIRGKGARERLSTALGVATSTTYAWSNGSRTPNRKHFNKLCDFFSIDKSFLEELLADDIPDYQPYANYTIESLSPRINFIGRDIFNEEEVISIADKLMSHDSTYRVVTVYGEKGVGKKKIITEVENRIRSISNFRISIVNINRNSYNQDLKKKYRIEDILIRHLLNPIRFRDNDIVESLVNFFKKKSLLVIPEIPKSMIEGFSTLASELIRECPDLKILVGSEKQLSVRHEYPYLVREMSIDEIYQMISNSYDIELEDHKDLDLLIRKIPKYPALIVLICGLKRLLDDESMSDLVTDIAKDKKLSIDNAYDLSTSESVCGWIYGKMSGTARKFVRSVCVFTDTFSLHSGINLFYRNKNREDNGFYSHYTEDRTTPHKIDNWEEFINILNKLVNCGFINMLIINGEERYSVNTALRDYLLRDFYENKDKVIEIKLFRHLDYYAWLCSKYVDQNQYATSGIKNIYLEIGDIEDALHFGFENLRALEEKRQAFNGKYWMIFRNVGIICSLLHFYWEKNGQISDTKYFLPDVCDFLEKALHIEDRTILMNSIKGSRVPLYFEIIGQLVLFKYSLGVAEYRTHRLENESLTHFEYIQKLETKIDEFIDEINGSDVEKYEEYARSLRIKIQIYSSIGSGIANFLKGNRNVAMHELENTIYLSGISSDKMHEFWGNLWMGRIKSEMDDLNSANDQFKKCLVIANDQANIRMIAWARMSMASVLLLESGSYNNEILEHLKITERIIPNIESEKSLIALFKCVKGIFVYRESGNNSGKFLFMQGIQYFIDTNSRYWELLYILIMYAEAKKKKETLDKVTINQIMDDWSGITGGNIPPLVNRIFAI